MTHRFACPVFAVLLVIATAAQAQQGLRPAPDIRSLSFAPIPAVGDVRAGRWEWPAGTPSQAYGAYDNAAWRAPLPVPARFSLGRGATERLLQRFAPRASEWIGSGWNLQFDMRNDRSELRPRLGLFALQRDFGAQRFTYSLYSGYRGPLAGLAPNQPDSTGYRLEWSRSLGDTASVGLSYASAGLYEDTDIQATPNYRLYGQYETRNLTLQGRYGFAPGWALSAEATAYGAGNPGGSLGLRLGVRHGF